ncbi:MAG TPA: histidine phosphatase family protein [Burkholderiales bacterium]|nr:histidine phosphatase family protein [Burkholderiales bacterium]
MAELVLVRHAQASFGADDYDKLSELGWRQSRWLGEYFAERGARFDRVVRGSLRRHAETLAGIAEGMGRALPADEDERLNEYQADALLRAHMGRSGGQQAFQKERDRREHFRVLREAMYAWTDGVLEVGEEHRFDGFRARVLEALAAMRSGAARRVLVVSSGGPISTMLAEVLGMPLRGVVDLNLQTRNTGITELAAGASRIHCVSFNNVPHLDRPDRAGSLTYS